MIELKLHDIENKYDFSMNWKKRAKNVAASVEIMQFYGDIL